MRLRTLKQGFISRERTPVLGRELVAAAAIGQIEPLFTDSKPRYLSWRDCDTD